MSQNPTKKLWYVEGVHLIHSNFVYLKLDSWGAVDPDSPNEAKWYLSGFGVMDDFGYTLDKDAWESPQEPAKIARANLAKEIAETEKYLAGLQNRLVDFDRLIEKECK